MTLSVFTVSPARKRLRVCVEWLGKVQFREDFRLNLSDRHQPTKEEELAGMLASIANIAKRHASFLRRGRTGITAEQPDLSYFVRTVIQPQRSLESTSGYFGLLAADPFYRDQTCDTRLIIWRQILLVVLDIQREYSPTLDTPVSKCLGPMIRALERKVNVENFWAFLPKLIKALNEEHRIMFSTSLDFPATGSSEVVLGDEIAYMAGVTTLMALRKHNETGTWKVVGPVSGPYDQQERYEDGESWNKLRFPDGEHLQDACSFRT